MLDLFWFRSHRRPAPRGPVAQREVAVATLCANTPDNLWCYALEMSADNSNYTRLVRDTGKTRYHLEHGKPYDGQVFPFACDQALLSAEDLETHSENFLSPDPYLMLLQADPG